MAMSLKAARVNQELSQEQVSKLIGVSPATICRWEKGTVKIPEAQFKKLKTLYQKSEYEIEMPSESTQRKEEAQSTCVIEKFNG